MERKLQVIPPGVVASCPPDRAALRPYGLSAGPLKPDNSPWHTEGGEGRRERERAEPD